MRWMMLISALGFGYISLSMWNAARTESNPDEKLRLRRSAFGTLALAIMGAAYAFYFSTR